MSVFVARPPKPPQIPEVSAPLAPRRSSRGIPRTPGGEDAGRRSKSSRILGGRVGAGPATAWLGSALHGLAFAAIFLGAHLIRCDGSISAGLWAAALASCPIVALIKLGAYLLLGCNRAIRRSIGLGDIARRCEAAALGSLCLLLPSLLTRGVWPAPGSVLVVDGGLTVLWLFGSGGGVGLLRDRYRRLLKSNQKQRVLVVGAGDAGGAVVRQIRGESQLGLEIVGLLDADPSVRGRIVAGSPVLGVPEDLEAIAARHRIQAVLIPVPAVPAPQVRDLSERCRRAGLQVRIIPGFDAIVSGKMDVSPHEVKVEELLRREPIRLDGDLVGREIEGRVVLVTGASGSIGSEICRQLLAFRPARLILLDHSENGVFYLERELRSHLAEGVEIVPVIASIRDEARVCSIFSSWRPNVVIHAAAHKHVPMMECNPGEAVKNNVFGTRILVDQALACGVESFVMVSTDKAVNPTSVMGACKRLAEAYVQSRAGAGMGRTRLVTVRFGNVLGSIGSVVPLFIEQVRLGGPVSVTHPEMTRYFMTIPEAAQLVLQAGAQGRGGEIFVLDMGEPLKVLDIARGVIRLSGQVEGLDVKIVYTGLRPGEKLQEELYEAGEELMPTAHPKILVARHHAYDPVRLAAGFERLAAAADGTPDEIISVLVSLVAGYRPCRSDPVQNMEASFEPDLALICR